MAWEIRRARTTPTHSGSQPTRVSRRGGQLCQRARSPRSKSRPARSAFSHESPTPPGPTTLNPPPDTTARALPHREFSYRYVNGRAVTVANLQDGDIVRVGRVA